ncbi:hypothetical protein DsansV1_C08g0082661 [Dioscorea sansibarensis]
MGCTASKVAAAEAGAESHGDRMPRPIKRRIEEIRRKQWRERRKDSIVSTTQLLSGDEERDFDTPAGVSLSIGDGDKGSQLCSAGSQESIEIGSLPAEATKEEGEKENKKEESIEVGDRSPEIAFAAKETKEKREGQEKVSEMDGTAEEKQEEMGLVPSSETNGAAEHKREETRAPPQETGGAADEEEEEPGSPSFRIYFEQRKRDSDDSFKSSSQNKGKDNKKAKEDSDSNGPSTSSHSHSEGREEMKSPKKERGKRLKALTKAPTRVNCFLHCYHHNHVNSPTSSVTSDDHSSPRHA